MGGHRQSVDCGGATTIAQDAGGSPTTATPDTCCLVTTTVVDSIWSVDNCNIASAGDRGGIPATTYSGQAQGAIAEATIWTATTEG